LYKNGYSIFDPDYCQFLRSKRSKRKSRSYRSGRGKGVLKGYNSVNVRPAEIESKLTLGHWEGDLVVGGKSTVVATLVERKTKYLKIIKMPGRSADNLADAMAYAFKHMPKALRGSLTWDQGKEIAGHKNIEKRTKMDVYVCDPRSPCLMRTLTASSESTCREELTSKKSARKN